MSEDFTFAQLRTFQCAARAGCFANAADQLQISQPSVSEQIRLLEERLGVSLFRRRRGTTPVLTAEGEHALEEVETILAAGQNLFALKDVDAYKVRVRISISPYLGETYLRKLIPQIYRSHPSLTIDVHPLVSPAEATRMLEAGDLDLVVYAQSVNQRQQPHTVIICELPLVVIAPPGTRRGLESGEISLSDFQFIFPGRREISARLARDGLREMNVTPRQPPIFVDFVDALAELVEDGKGIGRTMRYAVADRIADGRVEALDFELTPIQRIIARSPLAPPEASIIETMLQEVLIPNN